ncbi:hypothetical protein EJP77_15960 [Paenibacillus zeisoli]|uniref:PLP-dependent aminotransferase family protein n=1 Tax=Paenibacillus zeisoli TaxID=2496267 RepID=A0A3S1B674_9BACL|nr:hypothetical protein [Paenibacillus zeisoli]RUT29201.1 hypothetical protein EJP77_15960 [Paenibacillus zeisoli]
MKRSFGWGEEQEHDLISLAGEGIESGLYPVSKGQMVQGDEISVETGADSRKSWMGESATAGLIDLINNVSSFQGHLRIEESSLLLTTGRMEALELLLGELVKSGDSVVVENPASPAVLEALHRRQVKVLPVDCDSEGILPEALKSCLSLQKPVLVYITPDYSDTIGTLWSSIRRREIVEITQGADIWLLSDRSSAAAPFAAGTEHSLGEGRSFYEIGREQGHDERIAELMSMDGHGIHAGWIRAGETLIQRLKDAREGRGSANSARDKRIRAEEARVRRIREAREGRGEVEDSCPAGVSAQLLVQHAAALNREYAARRAEALAVLAGSRALGAVCQHAAGSGRFLWAELPAGMDSAALLRAARLKGAAFLPGARCCAGAGNTRTLRLSLAEQSRQRLRLGLARICEAAEEFTARWEQ